MSNSSEEFDQTNATTPYSRAEWRTGVAIGGGTAGLGLLTVVLLVALLFVCKRKCTRRSSYSPDTGAFDSAVTPTPAAKRGSTFRKKTSENGYSSPPSKLGHSYETVLPNFSKRPPAVKAPAQQYEIPLTKAATMPRELTQTTIEGNNGNSDNIKFSCSVKVRGSSPEPPAYMNVKRMASGEEVCALNPWNHHAKWSSHGGRGGGSGGGEQAAIENEGKGVYPGGDNSIAI